MENIEIQKRLDKIEQLLTAQSIQNKIVLNIDEVAQFTGLSKYYIYKLTSKNKIPFYKPEGKNLTFHRNEIEAWLLRNRQATNEELETEAANYSVNRLKSSI